MAKELLTALLRVVAQLRHRQHSPIVDWTLLDLEWKAQGLLSGITWCGNTRLDPSLPESTQGLTQLVGTVS